MQHIFEKKLGWSYTSNVESGQDQMLPFKIDEWLSFGTKCVLDLNAAKQVVTVYRPNHDPVMLTRDDIFTAEDILPGFALPLAKVVPNL
ncbi:MAG: hypothetical protein H8F28_00370 [Fibrella sp.]|nr:hypothetical protein [Armatimonadota bacterium]